jgi:hypothetical protein
MERWSPVHVHANTADAEKQKVAVMEGELNGKKWLFHVHWSPIS